MTNSTQETGQRFTAEKLKEAEKFFHEWARTYPDYVTTKKMLFFARDMAHELADLRARTERPNAAQVERMVQAFPRLMDFFSKHALPSLSAPSCIGCGHVGKPTITHMELPNVYLCTKCVAAIRTKPTTEPATTGSTERPNEEADESIPDSLPIHAKLPQHSSEPINVSEDASYFWRCGWNAYRNQLLGNRAQLTTERPNEEARGMKLVPLEPTQAMQERGAITTIINGRKHKLHLQTVRKIWSVMLAVAPKQRKRPAAASARPTTEPATSARTDAAQTDSDSAMEVLRELSAKASPGPFEHDAENNTILGTDHCPTCADDDCSHYWVNIEPADLEFLIASANYVTIRLQVKP